MKSKTILIAVALIFGAISQMLVSCDKNEELASVKPNASIEETSMDAKDVICNMYQFSFSYFGPNGEFYFIEFTAFEYIDTDKGIIIRYVSVIEGYVNGVKVNLRVYNPQDSENPYPGNYTLIDDENGLVFGSYDESEFFSHGTIIE